MPSPEDIEQQEQRLVAHRRTLNHYLNQRASQGADHAPPGVTNGIRDARAGIAHCKETLRGWGEDVKDHPDDIEPPVRDGVVRSGGVVHGALMPTGVYDRSPAAPAHHSLRQFPRTILLVIAALLFSSGVVVNLLSPIVEADLKARLGPEYERTIWIAFGLCFVVAVVAYVVERRAAAQPQADMPGRPPTSQPSSTTE